MEQSCIWVKLVVDWAADLGADTVCAGVSPRRLLYCRCTRSDEARPLLALLCVEPDLPTKALHYLDLRCLAGKGHGRGMGGVNIVKRGHEAPGHRPSLHRFPAP